MTEHVEPGRVEPGPDETGAGVGSAPWYRNPFFWAAIAGMVTVTVLRPFTRHVPDPPPVVGSLPAVELRSGDGQTVTLDGRVRVLAFITPDCGDACTRLLESLQSVTERFRLAGAPVDVVLLTPAPVTGALVESARVLRERAGFGPTMPVTAVAATAADACALLRAGLAGEVRPEHVDCSQLVDVAHAARLVLIDSSGRSRGSFAAGSRGLDELFHRTARVVREESEGGS